MGCDIHMYVEYHKKNAKLHNDKIWWRPFGARINPGRDYVLFGHIAGVRRKVMPVVLPRGIPDDMGMYSVEDFYLSIDDRYADTDSHFCSLEQARRYETYGRKIIDHNGAPWKVEHPDWHSATWLTPDELRMAIVKSDGEFPTEGTDDAYHALLEAMCALERRDNNVRVVIWFDN